MKPVLLLSDVHGNISALNAILENELDISEIWIAGDFIDYGVHNNEVLERMLEISLEYPILAVLGNHEDYYLNGDRSYYKPKKEHSKISSELTRNLVDKELFDKFLSQVKPKNSMLIAGDIFMIHDEKRVVYEDLFPYMDEWDQITPPMILISGHNHLPYDKVKQIGGVSFRVINPGSVGQPRDGNPNASYALLHLNENNIVSEFKRVSYDINKEALAIKSAGGHPFISNRIRIGI